MTTDNGNGQTRGLGELMFSRHGLVLAAFLAIAGYLLWTEHEAHLKAAVPYLPWLFLLACPLMHLFMHGGHGGHGNGGSHDDDPRTDSK